MAISEQSKFKSIETAKGLYNVLKNDFILFDVFVFVCSYVKRVDDDCVLVFLEWMGEWTGVESVLRSKKKKYSTKGSIYFRGKKRQSMKISTK